MKLLAKKEAQKGIKKNTEELLESNLRLRKMEMDVLGRLNTAKLNYDPEKVKALEDFERFCKDIMVKKSALLEELNAYTKLIDEKKELYYGLIAKQDALEERRAQILEESRKLDLREAFIISIEQGFKEKVHG